MNIIQTFSNAYYTNFFSFVMSNALVLNLKDEITNLTKPNLFNGICLYNSIYFEKLRTIKGNKLDYIIFEDTLTRVLHY